MTREKILAQVIAVIVDIFEEGEENIKEDMELSNIKNFDSLGRLNLFMALEQNFNIRFAIDEIISARRIEDIVDMVAGKTGG